MAMKSAGMSSHLYTIWGQSWNAYKGYLAPINKLECTCKEECVKLEDKYDIEHCSLHSIPSDHDYAQVMKSCQKRVLLLKIRKSETYTPEWNSLFLGFKKLNHVK